MLLLLWTSIGTSLKAQVPVTNNDKPARILFLLDASGSMDHPWSEQESRFQVASRLILTLMDSVHNVNPDVSFGLRAFGTQYPAQDSNCTDTKMEVAFSYQNRDQMEARLRYLHPLGFSPIAYSLERAATEDFTSDHRYAYSIILITDGGESCGGDICAVMENLLKKKISFKPYILTLIDYKPLTDEYKCLGQTLTVAKEAEIQPAVQKIIADNKRILTVRDKALTNVAKPGPQTPVIPPAQPPVVKTTTTPQPVKVDSPVVKPEVKPEPKPKTTRVVVQEPTTVEPQKPTIPTIKRLPIIYDYRKSNILFALPAPKPIIIPKSERILSLKEEDEPVIKQKTTVSEPQPIQRAKPVQRPQAGNTNQNKTPQPVEFFTKAEDAQETTLQIYFTNGSGVYYYTEPKIQIVNANTGKVVKDMYRNVSGTEPTPIPMTAGKYNIIVPTSSAKANNIVIEANKANKVYIRAGQASLGFYYTTEPNRPAKEFVAYVSPRFGSRKVTQQRCDTMLSYTPANYHIEINTQPKLIYNVDLDFSAIRMVAIPTPGTFQIANTTAIGTIQLWYQHGNAYEPFMNMNINGNPDAQKAALLPGPYQIRYFKSPKKPYDDPVIVPFRIESEAITTITLGD